MSSERSRLEKNKTANHLRVQKLSFGDNGKNSDSEDEDVKDTARLGPSMSASIKDRDNETRNRFGFRKTATPTSRPSRPLPPAVDSSTNVRYEVPEAADTVSLETELDSALLDIEEELLMIEKNKLEDEISALLHEEEVDGRAEL